MSKQMKNGTILVLGRRLLEMGKPRNRHERRAREKMVRRLRNLPRRK